MARVEVTLTTAVQYTCEKLTCTAGFNAFIPAGRQKSRWNAIEFANTCAKDNGWSCYRNRSNRYYCPQHEPADGTAGRQVW